MADIDDSLSSLFGNEEPICPYTGLRTFTEDEAIYFRGRESHVAKCLDLLAAQRFVMITGASGDGKSSLVFAGLLPEVRAGFLRARYSSWAVATFRPERSPLRNLAQSLATALRVESSAAAIETELEQGFSALVQLYQASPLCPPATLPEGLTPAEQRRYQLKSSNLLVVVDQFEEFFTNPENYTKDGPNAAAQTVVNLLLETTRLAQAENLPIYIVCTMRSDFVGQCADFRGLIEQVGASQYFVPRLLRHEFVEVIREPALLSGNRISERLVQRLLYDIRNGQDQLPVLQHALRRIWLAADEGREEMDLFHYAMVGGLSDALPAADQTRFDAWRATVPGPEQQFLLAHASLRNVLDAHANQLYYAATSLYNQTFEPPLPTGTAERVIEQTFRMLTRTDGQRVVRNRLTGAEITAIINDEALPWPVVCRILRPFRQPGTTFLSPLLGEDDDDRAVLPPDAVLDITHESLIRNWDHLAQWAVQEAEDVRVAQDFMQQANRWQANAENPGFLLPIGPYTYFSQWRRRKKSLSSWLAHYVASGSSTGPEASHRLAPAEAQAGVLTRFLEASRRRLVVPLLVARYGIGRLAAVVLLPLLLAGLGWWAWSARQRQSDYVAYSIVEERTPFLESPYESVDDKAHFLIQTDRLKNVVYRPWFGGRAPEAYAFPRMLDALKDDSLALDIELSMYSSNTMEYDSVERENPYTRRLLFDLNHRLGQAARHLPSTAAVPISARQRIVAVYTARLVMALTHYLLCVEQQKAGIVEPLAARRAAIQRLTAMKLLLLGRLYTYVRQEAEAAAGPAPSPVEFGFCLRVLLGQGDYQPTELAFLEGLSPFGKPATRAQFRRLFPPRQVLYANDGSIPHSGGYLSSAIAFAALRQPARVAQCLDSLRTQVTKVDDRDGGIAVLPYLVKYGVFTPENALDLLRRCSRIGGYSFNETYAAAVYSLLSVTPSYAVYDVSSLSYGSTNALDAARVGTVNPDNLNADRVSFTVPLAIRDKAWQVLLSAAPRVAAGEPLFIEHNEHAFQAQPITAAKYQRNLLFLQAFLAKMHGVYLWELKHQPEEAARSFSEFSTRLQELQRACRPGERVNTFQWNLSTPVALGITEASTVEQNPITFLREPTRPKTLFFESYYTCSFSPFFTYQLQHEAAQPLPDAGVVQLLDSVAFVEAVFPDRYSGVRVYSLRTSALGRSSQDIPNLVWIKALTTVKLNSPTARQQRNAMLFIVSAALQSPTRLRQLTLTPNLLSFVRQLPSQPAYSQEPLQIVFSSLTAAFAHEGRIPEAFKLANALGEPMATISKIRIAEQAMLTNNQAHQAMLDGFLGHYRQQSLRYPENAAGSIISVLYWRPYADDRHNATFYQLAGFLIKEGNSFVQGHGQLAMCKGRSLANHDFDAVRDIPAYESERLRQPYFNAVLLGLAHLKTTSAGDGWHEYDDWQLASPRDYDGPTD
ncbi:energy-coupling factor transporter ATP-binding protein EcfA2 [Hymenobacter sp. UYAg731]